MWNVKGNDLEMVVGDFGVELPVTVSDTTFTENDKLKFTFKSAANGDTILEKEFDSIDQNTAQLMLTEAESALFQIGSYVYSLDWYQSGVFMCNVVPAATFKVVSKA